MDVLSLAEQTVRLTIVGAELQDSYIRPKIGSGQETKTFVAQVHSVDELGIWIKVLDYPVYDNVDRRKEEHTALILIRYEYISSIVHFPEVEEDENKPNRIGFVAEDTY